MSDIKYAEYAVDRTKKIITKDGHTMFADDVATELNRKSYLEEQAAQQAKDIEELRDGWLSWIDNYETQFGESEYSVEQRAIANKFKRHPQGDDDE